MKTEKIVISFIAVLVGILVAGTAFYFYQSTKTIPSSKTKTITISAPTPTPSASVFLTIDNPKDEEVLDSKTITISGKTTNDAVILILSKTQEEVFTPASNGNFSATISLEDGENHIEITAIGKNGEETKTIRTVTFSTENF